MAVYSTNEFKNGLKVMIDGSPCNMVDVDFVKPGKGQAFCRVKYRNLLTGRVIEKTWQSGESLEGADVMDTEMEYLYTDGETWHFMNTDTYEQIEADAAAMGDTAQWIKGQEKCIVTLWNDRPIAVEPPNFVELAVVETDPGVRGDTSGGGGKPATLEGGAVVRVPLFIDVGELLKVDTRTGVYVSRVKQ